MGGPAWETPLESANFPKGIPALPSPLLPKLANPVMSHPQEVEEPILNSAFEEPTRHWYIREGHAPQRRPGRRAALVFRPRDQRQEWDLSDGTLVRSSDYPAGYELALLTRI